jgi:hypothetical protein
MTVKKLAPRYCKECGERIYDAQRAVERISGGYVPLRTSTSGGANSVYLIQRTGDAYHWHCLRSGTQMELFSEDT